MRNKSVGVATSSTHSAAGTCGSPYMIELVCTLTKLKGYWCADKVPVEEVLMAEEDANVLDQSEGSGILQDGAALDW